MQRQQPADARWTQAGQQGNKEHRLPVLTDLLPLLLRHCCMPCE
jgi:hypothetical protein